MSATSRSSTAGGVVAFVLGAVVGLGVGYPALPGFGGFDPQIAGQSPGAVGTVLLVGALVVLVLPIVMMALYQAFSLLDQ